MRSQYSKIAYPTGIVRLAALSPVALYRVGLGWLVAMLPILILTTRGRNTRMPRFTPLEYRRHGSMIYVISAWGERANWYQNLIAFPYGTIKIGRRTYSVQASAVEEQSEAVRALYLFRNSVPFLSYEHIYEPFNTPDEVANLARLNEIADQFVIVRLDILDEPLALPAVPSDRVWIWGALLLGAVLVSLFGEVIGRARSEQEKLL